MEPASSKKSSQVTDQQIRRRTFLSFAAFAGLNAAGYFGWKKLKNSPVEPKGITAAAKVPTRRALNKTELAFRRIFSRNHLVKTYPKSAAAKNVRLNGNFGIKAGLKQDTWKLNVTRRNGEVLGVTLDDIKRLPKTELIFDFKCVEGWDQVQHWGGVKFTDFVKHYQLLPETEYQYAGLETPDRKYYVGIDMDSMMHEQTLLAYEMNDEELQEKHGAPLRLIVPVKYGIKNLKQIGSITFSDRRPRDYWAERGYDYYSGL